MVQLALQLAAASLGCHLKLLLEHLRRFVGQGALATSILIEAHVLEAGAEQMRAPAARVRERAGRAGTGAKVTVLLWIHWDQERLSDLMDLSPGVPTLWDSRTRVL